MILQPTVPPMPRKDNNMGYQPLDPKSAKFMKVTAQNYIDSLLTSNLEKILKQIRENAEYGCMCLSYKGAINKRDIKDLKGLGYRVTKNWFKQGYTIWWNECY